MVYRKRKKPRRKRKGPSRRDSLVSWLRRSGLYGAAALTLIVGIKVHRSLRESSGAVDAPYRQITIFKGELGGSRLKTGLLESGSDEAEAKKILRSLRKVGGVGRLHIGDSYRIERSTDGTFHHLTMMRGKTRTIVSPDGEGFHVARMSTPMKIVEKTARGAIQGSLWLAMSRERVPAEIIQEYADVFQWTVDFLTETRNGDEYAVVWTEKRTPDGRIWGRDIHAALYDGKRTKQQVAVQFEDYFYDEDGDSLKRMFLRAPLNFRRISSHFSKGRWHPILRKRRPHNGIDYAAPRGTPVVAIGAGTVALAGWNGGYGKCVEIRHNATFKTLYGHLSRYGKGIRKGRRVQQGDVIGYVGSTGLSSGPHLHFQVAKNGRWVNFLRLNLPKAKKLAKNKRDAYKKVLERRMKQMLPEKPAPERDAS